MTLHLRRWALLCIAAALTSCGGGGSDLAPSTPTAARGLYQGALSNGRVASLVVLSDGTFWGIYSDVSNDNLIAGVLQGRGNTGGNSFTSTNGRDFNLEGLGILTFSAAATFSEMASFSGTATYSGGGGSVTYSGTYEDSFDDAPVVTALAGTYTGEAATSDGTEAASVTINSAGTFTGSGSSGCTFSGSLAPRTDGNVFDVAITFNGGVCVNGSNTIRGIALYDATDKQLIAAALNNSRTDGAIFVGVKP